MNTPITSWLRLVLLALVTTALSSVGIAQTGGRPPAGPPDASTRLTNLSVRGRAGSSAQTLNVGFTLGGSPDKPVLLRVIGPSLAQFGVTDALADPALLLFTGNVVQRANDDWAIGINGESLVNEHRNAFALVGAFPLDSSSKDSAFIKSMTARGYTAQVAGGATPGTVLFELYDLFPESGASFSNLSARAQVSPGAGALIAGFVVTGTAPKQILLRGVGPGLASQGITDVLANPILELYRGATVIQSNDDWSGTAALTAAFTAAGAFALPSATSRDAAMVVTLAPGAYTAIVSSATESGIALVEIYELP
jgi:hypothetical protein